MRPNVTRTLRLPLAILGLVLILVGCGRKRDWDQEVIVQVFKPVGVNVGKVTVEAKQGSGAAETTQVSGFADCGQNQVRIIPGSAGGSVRITVTASAGGLAAVTRDVALPATNPVKVVLGSSASVEPKGTCTPPPTPDGGPGDGGNLPIGSPCANAGQCAGGVCLSQVQNLGTVITLSGGYCSRTCDSAAACEGADAGIASCWINTDGNGKPLSKFCLKPCKVAGDCGRTGYTCTPGNLCMPE